MNENVRTVMDIAEQDQLLAMVRVQKNDLLRARPTRKGVTTDTQSAASTWQGTKPFFIYN